MIKITLKEFDNFQHEDAKEQLAIKIIDLHCEAQTRILRTDVFDALPSKGKRKDTVLLRYIEMCIQSDSFDEAIKAAGILSDSFDEATKAAEYLDEKNQGKAALNLVNACREKKHFKLPNSLIALLQHESRETCLVDFIDACLAAKKISEARNILGWLFNDELEREYKAKIKAMQ